MTMMKKMLAGGTAIAALAAAAPAAAQYAYPYNPYAPSYGYNNNAYMTQVATQRCSAAVQQRLSQPNGLAGILGAVVGVPQATGRVLSITQVNPNRNTVRVRGLATSGRYAGYSPWGVGAYGAAGYAYQPDLSFKCDVDYRGYVRDVDINRR